VISIARLTTVSAAALLLAGAASAWQDDAIRWSPSRPLAWEDFKGKPPAGYLHGALSALSYSYAVGCRDGVLQAEIAALFLPRQSWVAQRILTSGLASRVGLQHEQVHFDLSEVYARRVRQRFATLEHPCPRTDDQLNQIAEEILREHSAAQRRFEDETRAGELESRQIEWRARVDKELEALAAFAR
jgi:hypothetical protein